MEENSSYSIAVRCVSRRENSTGHASNVLLLCRRRKNRSDPELLLWKSSVEVLLVERPSVEGRMVFRDFSFQNHSILYSYIPFNLFFKSFSHSLIIRFYTFSGCCWLRNEVRLDKSAANSPIFKTKKYYLVLIN